MKIFLGRHADSNWVISSAPVATRVAARLIQSAILIFALSAARTSWAAQNIEFPEEELATESVLPVFDQPVSVKNRKISLTSKFEGSLNIGYSMTEAFFNPLSYGASVTYHLNEDSGINIFGLIYAGGLSDKGQALNGSIQGVSSSEHANLQNGPQNKYLLIGNYEFTAYYGKISLTKDYAMNLHLYGLAGLGILGMGDGTLPVGSLGIGQKFYFSSHFALRADLRFLFYEGPNILSARLDNTTSQQSNSYFSNKFFTEGLMTVGADFL